MLPHIYSTDIISLNTNGKKKVITVELQYNGGTLIAHKVFLSDIQVKCNITYDEAQKKKNQTLFSDIFRLTGARDIHKVVEKLMIIANSYIAETLCAANIYFLRACESNPVSYTVDTDIECLSYLHKRNKQGAQYTTEDKAHELLGIQHYTHFTSPIRRYADLIVQRLLKSILYNEPAPYSNEELHDIACRINECNARVKRYYRDASIVKLYKDIGDYVTRTEGYVVQYNEISNAVTVYLPEYNMEYSYALYSDKLKHLWSVCDEGDLLRITCGTENHTEHTETSTIVIPKYKELDINLSTNSQEIRLNKKVIMRICAITESLLEQSA